MPEASPPTPQVAATDALSREAAYTLAAQLGLSASTPQLFPVPLFRDLAPALAPPLTPQDEKVRPRRRPSPPTLHSCAQLRARAHTHARSHPPTPTPAEAHTNARARTRTRTHPHPPAPVLQVVASVRKLVTFFLGASLGDAQPVAILARAGTAESFQQVYSSRPPARAQSPRRTPARGAVVSPRCRRGARVGTSHESSPSRPAGTGAAAYSCGEPARDAPLRAADLRQAG